eukprot:scaffold4717_cov66-Cyclotella_meneghiniana.AAC.1
MPGCGNFVILKQSKASKARCCYRISNRLIVLASLQLFTTLLRLRDPSKALLNQQHCTIQQHSTMFKKKVNYRLFKCNNCKLIFRNASSATSHEETCFDFGWENCSVCGLLRFRTESERLNHEAKCKGSDSYSIGDLPMATEDHDKAAMIDLASAEGETEPIALTAIRTESSSSSNNFLTDKADNAQVAKSPPAASNLYPLFEKVDAKLKSPGTPNDSSTQSLLSPDPFKQASKLASKDRSFSCSTSKDSLRNEEWRVHCIWESRCTTID